MTNKELCLEVAKRVNENHNWQNKNSSGWITPKIVANVQAGKATANHPITQEIQALLRKVFDERSVITT